MSENSPQRILQQELERLEARIDELVEETVRLKEENDSLRAQQGNLATERASLLQKNEQARHRVEAMISRLKSLEQA